MLQKDCNLSQQYTHIQFSNNQSRYNEQSEGILLDCLQPYYERFLKEKEDDNYSLNVGTLPYFMDLSLVLRFSELFWIFPFMLEFFLI